MHRRVRLVVSQENLLCIFLPLLCYVILLPHGRVATGCSSWNVDATSAVGVHVRETYTSVGRSRYLKTPLSCLLQPFLEVDSVAESDQNPNLAYPRHSLQEQLLLFEGEVVLLAHSSLCSWQSEGDDNDSHFESMYSSNSCK